MKAGAYYEWVNNKQPGNGNSNGALMLAELRHRLERQLLLGSPDRNLVRVQRAVTQRRPRHGVQHLRGLRAGQLEGEGSADARVRTSPLASWSMDRTRRRGHGRLRSGLVQPQCAVLAVPWTDVDGTRLQRSAVGCKGQIGFPGATSRGRVRSVRHRQDAVAWRLRSLQLPRSARAVLGLHRSAVRRDADHGEQRSAFTGAVHQPQLAAWPERRNRGRRRQVAAHAELELHGSAAHPVPDDGGSRVRGQQERSPAERRHQRHQHRPVRRDDQRSERRPEQISSVVAVWRRARVAAHALSELQRTADAAEPTGKPVQLHGRVHLVQGARYSRRRAGVNDAAAGRHPRFGLRRARVRPSQRLECRLQLAAPGHRR